MAKARLRESTITCPQIPAALAAGLPPPGSAQWCAWIDDVLRFVREVGKAVSTWVDKELDYWQWRNAINAYRNALIDAGGVDNAAWIRLLGWFIDVLDKSLFGLDIGKDLLRCMLHWRNIVVGANEPEAYLGVLVVRGVLKSVKSAVAGWQFAGRFTVQLGIEIPALEQLLDHLLLYLAPLTMPSEGEATQAWLRGYIDKDQRDCVWKYHGHNPKGYEPYVLAQAQRMSLVQTLEYARRLDLDKDRLGILLAHQGVAEPEQLEALQVLYDRLATQGEVLNWERSQVVNEDYVKRYQLNAGFDERYWPAMRYTLPPQGINKAIAQKNYQAHWQQLGVGQLQQFLWRLGTPQPGILRPFGITEFRDHVEMLGYSPSAADWLTETAYRALSVGEAIDLYRRGQLSLEELATARMATGMHPVYANAFARRDAIEARYWRVREFGGWEPASAGRAFAVGLLSHEQVAEVLSPLGASGPDVIAAEQRGVADFRGKVYQRALARVLASQVTMVKDAIATGTMDTAHAAAALQKAGWPKTAADGLAQAEDAAAKTDLVKQALTALRAAYLRGEVTLQYTERAMQQLGIVPTAIARYHVSWKIQLTPNRKRRNAKQIVNDLSENLITIEDATARLRNLGYEDVDTRLFLADAQRAMVQTQAAQIAARELRGSSLQQGLIDAHNQLQGLSKRVVSELRTQASPVALKRYFVGGLLDEAAVRYRLQLYNWEPSAIDLFIQDAQSAKDKKNAPKPAKAKPATKSRQSPGPSTQPLESASPAVP